MLSRFIRDQTRYACPITIHQCCLSRACTSDRCSYSMLTRPTNTNSHDVVVDDSRMDWISYLKVEACHKQQCLPIYFHHFHAIGDKAERLPILAAIRIMFSDHGKSETLEKPSWRATTPRSFLAFPQGGKKLREAERNQEFFKLLRMLVLSSSINQTLPRNYHHQDLEKTSRKHYSESLSPPPNFRVFKAKNRNGKSKLPEASKNQAQIFTEF
ncbi:hypothetical protein VNO77_14683 [Canavalia gladiata]|uniref:Uncharacterized protein n=1 Tax=Canavalia gladiata TaxID=3824 RepID=A0AAN9QNU3_CANGL